MHLTAGCAIVVLCRLKYCSLGGQQEVRMHEVWVERLLELGPGHPESSMTQNSAARRIGLRASI